MNTIAEALNTARRELPAVEARLLLSHVLNQSAAWLMTHDDARLDEDASLNFAALVARRAAGEPVAYLLGRREFYGREFYVAPGVLIPRPETELLVDVVRAKVGVGDTATILDLGTGSGCIAITLALELAQADVTAVDASPDALRIARQNTERMGAKLRLVQSDWFAALSDARFDLIVSNPPYISVGDAHLLQGDLRHEPASALASGRDGLDAIRHIVSHAAAHLKPGGSLWLEHGYDQALVVSALLATSDFVAIEQHYDLAGIVRVTGGFVRS